MKLPPSLGLRTINIAPFEKGLIFYQSTCPEFRYGDENVLSFSHSTSGSTSTHCIPNLNLIEGNFNMLF